jgi:histone deacetylase 8
MQDFYNRILYVDLDLHHGDGVENAFYFSDRVFTLSLHKFKPGFFPGSGGSESIGRGKGVGFCKNITIAHEISGSDYHSLFQTCFTEIITSFDPDIMVCVCGADTLSTDPHLGFNLGSVAYSRCIESILSTEIPTVFLGGGRESGAKL